MKNLTCLLPGMAAILLLTACSAPSTQAPVGERPMDEVPRQTQLSNGDRQYAFRNGCVIVLDSRRAVVKSEGAACALHHRDIALLYASGD
jgi:outer membrane biogenesis lipoprotein LolB